MPDALLDVVKDEQTRAREAGKSARGGTHVGGGTGRGESYARTILVLALIRLPSSQVVEHHEVRLHPASLVL